MQPTLKVLTVACHDPNFVVLWFRAGEFKAVQKFAHMDTWMMTQHSPGPLRTLCIRLCHFCILNLFISVKNFPRASHLQALGKNKLNIGDEPCIGSIASQHKNSDQMSFTSFWPTAGQLDHMIFLPYILWQHWEALASEAPIPQVLPATTPDRCTEIWDDAWATNRMKLRSFIFNSARPLFTASVPEQR